MATLFPDASAVEFAPGAVLFRAAVAPIAHELVCEITRVIDVSPLRTVMTPMGKSMSVEMTNCGHVGWVSDRTGYRYETHDPLTGKPWSTMPAVFADLAVTMAARAGYDSFAPDACLINRYSIGSKMGLHQDRDERDFSKPIVSVSLGLPIRFNFGGERRTDPTTKVDLHHGDVVVFGGTARHAFHGVGTLRRGTHELTGAYRYNLTFRAV